MKNKAEQDLVQIRLLMEQSTRFLSLIGLSGIFAGIFALLGVLTIFSILNIHEIDYFDGEKNYYSFNVILKIGITLFFILLLSICFAIYFTRKKIKTQKDKIWTSTTKQWILQLLIPLVTGGIICLLFIYHNLFYLVIPSTLIFYGLALINSSKYTFSDIFSLGILEIILGILSLLFLGYGLIFWALGFGILHIIYGILMYKKYR